MGEWGRLDVGGISKESALALGYLIVFGSLIGFASYSWLLRAAPIALVSTYAYVNPMVAVFLGYMIADERLTWQILLSSAIIIGSVALINSVRFRSMRKLRRSVTIESPDS